MNALDKLIRQELPFFEIYERLSAIPSPRMQFALHISKVSGLSLTTILQMVSQTDSYLAPSLAAQARIARALQLPVHELFPNDKLQKGSLAYRYSKKSRKQEDLHQFITLVSRICHRHPKTVRSWMKLKQLPHTIKKEYLANALGVPVDKLFPNLI